MSIGNDIKIFNNLKVEQFYPDQGIQSTNKAIRLGYGEDWDDDDYSMAKLLKLFAKDPKSSEISSLVFGAWEDPESESMAKSLNYLIKKADKFSKIKALFFGDITYNYCEISWIIQSDYSELWAAFPQLETLVIRGTSNLTLSQNKISHQNLKHFTIESGGIPADVWNQIIEMDTPNLEHLELWLGGEEYGFEYTESDIQNLLQKPFPKLKHLALANSEIQDKIVKLVLGSSLLPQLESLDFSKGTMSDEAAELLLKHAAVLKGKKIDLSDNFISDEMLKKLTDSGLTFEAGEQEYADDEDDRYISVSE